MIPDGSLGGDEIIDRPMYQFPKLALNDVRLKGVACELWDMGKHDVGIIKNCPPVQIIAKSDYRPGKAQ